MYHCDLILCKPDNLTQSHGSLLGSVCGVWCYINATDSPVQHKYNGTGYQDMQGY